MLCVQKFSGSLFHIKYDDVHHRVLSEQLCVGCNNVCFLQLTLSEPEMLFNR